MVSVTILEEYFEEQRGAWCGLHALNNYLGGPYVTEDACGLAARQVVRALSEAGGGDLSEGREEAYRNHLHPGTGFLSIDVINVLGAGNLGLHVQANAASWLELQTEAGSAALINWNNYHWTVLRQAADGETWVHCNSITQGRGRRHGRTQGMTCADVEMLLAEVQQCAGGCTLHRITRAAGAQGAHYLEREGLRAMVEAGVDDAVDEVGDARMHTNTRDLSLVTVNVDGLGEYQATPGARMRAILPELLRPAPDVIMLQEVVDEMYVVLKQCLPDWKIYRRRGHDFPYFVVTAMRTMAEAGEERTTSYAFPESQHGRHLLTIRRKGWVLTNVHAESGRGRIERDERAAQLLHMSRAHEREVGETTCVLAGDLNVRQGEDQCLLQEGWSDASANRGVADVNEREEWTWRSGANMARYDRVYTRGVDGGSSDCISYARLRTVWGAFTDHVALHVVLRQSTCMNHLCEVEVPGAAAHEEQPAVGRYGVGAREQISVTETANLIVQFAADWRRQAAACLLDPETIAVEDAQLPPWAQVPTEGGFRVARPGGRAGQHCATQEEKTTHCRHYARYMQWVEIVCGGTEVDFKSHLKAAASLHEDMRGSEGLPAALQTPNHAGDAQRVSVAQHASWLFRVDCLRKAAARDGPKGPRGPPAELERLMSLTAPALRSECDAVATRLRAAHSLKMSSHCSTVEERAVSIVGLFQLWLFAEGARALFAEDPWRGLTSAETSAEIFAPDYFALDGVVFDAKALQQVFVPAVGDLSQVRRGNASLFGAWWCLTWETAAREVLRRFSSDRRMTRTGETQVTFSMEELYRKLFLEAEVLQPRNKKDTGEKLLKRVAVLEQRERDLLQIWQSLELFEKKSGRAVASEELGRFKLQYRASSVDSRFDRQTLCTLWTHAVQAWEAGWPSTPQGEPGFDLTPPTMIPLNSQAADEELTAVPRHEVQILDNGWYKWRGFRRQAIDDDDGWKLLNEDWREQQQRHAIVSRRARDRKEQMRLAVSEDTRQRPGVVVQLDHPRYKKTYSGRMQEDGRKISFVEEGSWMRVTVEIPADLQGHGRGPSAWRDTQLYNALRGEHAKANRKANLASRRKMAEEQIPKTSGDLQVKARKEDTGQLVYAWKDFEVPVTPREHRPTLLGGESLWKQARARETTPDRALRKITEKVKRNLDKAARGECQTIVARADPSDAPATGSAGPQERQQHPAIAQLNDPAVLEILRKTYEYLGSARLHYCENCDEQWPVFDGQWPKAGVICAGSRAGVCETITKTGFMADTKKPDLCSRCGSSSVYGTMYCAANLQHLGPRWEPLSNLTWFESLLIARVHPVISVVTLTSTGLLCFAGHVCNYYLKVLEWFQGLPAVLRDKKWFLVKRRKSVNASSTSETRHKRPTTANRQRLEAGIREAILRMPNVYAGSELNAGELAKYPMDAEQESRGPVGAL